MRKINFIPVIFATIMAMFLVVSCDKEEAVEATSTIGNIPKEYGAFSKNLTLKDVTGHFEVVLNISTDDTTGCVLADYSPETVHLKLLNELPENELLQNEFTTASEGNTLDESTLMPVHIHLVSKNIPKEAKGWSLSFDNLNSNSRTCLGYNGNLNYYYDYTYPYYVSISQPTNDGKCVSAWFQERLNGVWGIYGPGCGGNGGFYLCATPSMACGGGGNPLRVKALAPIGTPYTLCNNN